MFTAALNSGQMTVMFTSLSRSASLRYFTFILSLFLAYFTVFEVNVHNHRSTKLHDQSALSQYPLALANNPDSRR